MYHDYISKWSHLFENNIIPKLIKNLIKNYEENDIPYCDINSGSCNLFAEDLYDTLRNHGIDSEILNDGDFFDPFDDESEINFLNPNDYGISPKDFKVKGLPSHYWIYANGKHYDSDTPNGVSDMFQLPIIKRFYSKKEGLLEKSLSEVNIDKEVFTPEFIKEMMDSDAFSNFCENFRDTEDSDLSDAQLQDIYIEDLKITTDSFLYDINKKIKNGEIDIYREITVPSDYVSHLIKEGKHLGIYWSYDEYSAEAHWGGGSQVPVKPGQSRIDVTLISKIQDQYINWIETIRLNAHHITGDEEKEIRLFKGTPLKILGIKSENKNLDISKIRDKTFYA